MIYDYNVGNSGKIRARTKSSANYERPQVAVYPTPSGFVTLNGSVEVTSLAEAPAVRPQYMIHQQHEQLRSLRYQQNGLLIERLAFEGWEA